MAATVPVEKAGDVNPLLEQAQQIGIADPDKNNTDSDGKPKTAEPVAGSYERFMASFGAPQRWAGRG